jgi:hypothetical protein
MKKMKKTTEMCRRLTKNDYVRLLLTKTFQKNVCKKKIGRKSSWISFRKLGIVNDVVYLLTFASYFDVNKHGVCQHPEGWHKVPMSSHTQGSLAI